MMKTVKITDIKPEFDTKLMIGDGLWELVEQCSKKYNIPNAIMLIPDGSKYQLFGDSYRYVIAKETGIEEIEFEVLKLDNLNPEEFITEILYEATKVKRNYFSEDEISIVEKWYDEINKDYELKKVYYVESRVPSFRHDMNCFESIAFGIEIEYIDNNMVHIDWNEQMHGGCLIYDLKINMMNLQAVFQNELALKNLNLNNYEPKEFEQMLKDLGYEDISEQL